MGRKRAFVANKANMCEKCGELSKFFISIVIKALHFLAFAKLHLGNGIGESYPHTSLDLARSS